MQENNRPGLALAIIAIVVVLLLCLVYLTGCRSLLSCVVGPSEFPTHVSGKARAVERVFVPDANGEAE